VKKIATLILIIFSVLKVFSQAIGITSPVTSVTYCPGSGANVAYTISGTFSNTPSVNVFSAQISDAAGSFGGTPATIGTNTSIAGGTITCTLPSTLFTSGLYRFRVVSSNPPVNSSDNGANLTVFAVALNSPSVVASAFCQNETFTVNFSQSLCNFVNFPAANIYSVELSNASGSFASPVVIGTRTSIIPAAITCTMPLGTPAGAGYRIRMSASSPAVTGPDNGSNIAVQVAAGNPTDFGNGTWNVHCFETRNNYVNNYQGFYTENSLSFNTTTRWANTASPSSANSTGGSAYAGCSIGTVDYSYSYKRTNIPCGYYQIDIPSRRNEVYIIINGVTVFQNTVCCAAITNAWRGVILPTDNIEIRSSNLSPQGFLQATFTKLNQVTLSAPVTICASTNASLTVTNTGTLPVTYSWTPSASVSPSTGSAVIASPSVTTNYTVTATASSCPVFTGAVLVTVNALPTTNTSISTTVICNGFSTSQIIATGANTYSWSPAAGLNTTSGNSVTASPTVATIYTVTGSNNCSNLNATRTVSVQNTPSSPSPTVFGNGFWNVFCYNSSTFANLFGHYTENNLNFSTTDRWASGSSPSAVLTTTAGSGYNGCNLTNATHGTIHRRTNFPCGYYRINLIHDDLVLLVVNSVTVFTNLAAATDNGVWTGFLGPSSTVEIRHANTSGGTSLLTTSFVPVSLPALSPPVTICAGTTATLTAVNIAGLSYSWTPGNNLSATTGTRVLSTATVSTNYTCTVTDPVTSCTAASSTSVAVDPFPTTTISPTSATINCSAQIFTLNTGGANTYSWSPSVGLSATTGNSVIATPTVSTTYTVEGSNNCSTLNATVFVSVVPLVNPTVFPTGTWNAYCYNSTSFTNYFGYYTENGSGASGCDFNTTTRWSSGAAPSTANATNGNAYLGCTMPTTNWSMRFTRTGFTCNTYSIHVLNNDKTVTLFINGVQVATRAASTNSTALWVGPLSSASTVELRLVQTTGGTSGLRVQFTPAAASVSTTIWSGASSNNWFTASNWCGSSIPSATNDVIVYNSGTLFQPVISANGAVCKNLTISSAIAATGTLSAIAAAGLTVSGAFPLNIHGNWVNGGTFAPGSGTVNILGSGSKTMSSVNTENFVNLVINSPGTISVPSGTIQISGNMNLTSGIFITGGRLRFLIGSSVSNANNSSYVEGTIVKFGNQAFTFPLGNNGLYRPIGISAPVAAGDNFTAQFLYADPSPTFIHTSKDASIDHISRCEYWVLDRTGGTSIVNVTLSWNSNSCGVNSLADLLVTRWDAGQVKWKNQGNGATTGNTTAGTVISGSLVTVFSPFTLGSSSALNPLPVELLDFKANCVDAGTELNWSTASERNNDYFLIERSTDGIDWQEVSSVKPSQSNTNIKKYSHVHPFIETEIDYYRLTQVDKDGRRETFKIISSECKRFNSDFKFYPNPANDEITLEFNSPFDIVKGTIIISDQLGRVCLNQPIDFKQGITRLPIPLKLQTGVYVISFSSDNFPAKAYKLLIN
jgi:hypothetical protein